MQASTTLSDSLWNLLHPPLEDTVLVAVQSTFQKILTSKRFF